MTSGVTKCDLCMLEGNLEDINGAYNVSMNVR